MNVIAKMAVQSIEDYGQSRKIKLSCEYDGKINLGYDAEAENRSFTKATPSGECWMTVDNRAVWPAFHPYREIDGVWQPRSVHYLLFVDASKHSLEDVYRALASLDAGADSAE